MGALRNKLGELLLRQYWVTRRDVLETAVIPGCGGVVLLGDSITCFGRWDLMFPTVTTLNFGIAGERSDQLLTRLAPIITVKPSKLFLLIGTNDLAAGAEIEAIVGNVDQLIERIALVLPDCEIYLQTVMPRAEKFAARIRELNTAYAVLAVRRGITLLDLFPLFDDGTGKIRAQVTYDDLHLNGAGYQVWREILEPCLANCHRGSPG